jgi:hypothetical protein
LYILGTQQAGDGNDGNYAGDAAAGGDEDEEEEEDDFPLLESISSVVVLGSTANACSSCSQPHGLGQQADDLQADGRSSSRRAPGVHQVPAVCDDAAANSTAAAAAAGTASSDLGSAVALLLEMKGLLQEDVAALRTSLSAMQAAQLNQQAGGTASSSTIVHGTGSASTAGSAGSNAPGAVVSTARDAYESAASGHAAERFSEAVSCKAEMSQVPSEQALPVAPAAASSLQQQPAELPAQQVLALLLRLLPAVVGLAAAQAPHCAQCGQRAVLLQQLAGNRSSVQGAEPGQLAGSRREIQEAGQLAHAILRLLYPADDSIGGSRHGRLVRTLTSIVRETLDGNSNSPS